MIGLCFYKDKKQVRIEVDIHSINLLSPFAKLCK
jgi:hypothetical protein